MHSRSGWEGASRTEKVEGGGRGWREGAGSGGQPPVLSTCLSTGPAAPLHTYSMRTPPPLPPCLPRLGDFTGAVEDFTAAIQLDPHCSDFYHNRGFSYRKVRAQQAGRLATHSRRWKGPKAVCKPVESAHPLPHISAPPAPRMTLRLTVTLRHACCVCVAGGHAGCRD